MSCTFDYLPGAHARAWAAAGLAFALTTGPSLASAEEEGAAPIEYQVIEDPEQPDQPPPPPSDYGQQQQQQPAYGEPAQTQGPVVVAAPVVTAETGGAQQPAAAARGAYPTGVSGGFFFSYSPQGRVANFDPSSDLVSTGDFPASLGFGGHILGLGRHFGAGARLRVVWLYDTDVDSTWSMTDVEAILRGRGRWGRFEFYGGPAVGFAVQRLSYTDSFGDGYSDSSGGMTFGASIGFRVFANDFLSFFLEPGMHWRLFFSDVTGGTANTLGIRQFTLEAGINFGA